MIPSKSTLNVGAKFEGPCMIKSSPDGLISCGAYTDVQSGSRLSNCLIGRYCSIGPSVNFGSPQHRMDWLSAASAFTKDYEWTKSTRNFPLTPGGVVHSRTTVGNDVWIGNGAFIKAGITIGDGAVIGARAVVTKDVLPYSVVGGTPAKHIRFRFPEDVVGRLLRAKWWQLDLGFLNRVDFRDVEAVLDLLEAEADSLPPFRPATVVIAPMGKPITVKSSG
jgi:acetyltransferase-like isoleucine patch superfamily enzyme